MRPSPMKKKMRWKKKRQFWRITVKQWAAKNNSKVLNIINFFAALIIYFQNSHITEHTDHTKYERRNTHNLYLDAHIDIHNNVLFASAVGPGPPRQSERCVGSWNHHFKCTERQHATACAIVERAKRERYCISCWFIGILMLNNKLAVIAYTAKYLLLIY